MELTKEKWNDIFHQKSISNWAEALLTFRPKFRLRVYHSEVGLEEIFFVNGTTIFGRIGLTGQKVPPPEVVANIPVGPNRNGPFHLTSAQNFQKL